MGVRLSIDKHVSNLHELLEMSAQYFQKVRFASKISDDIKQHLKVSLINRLTQVSADLALPRRQQQVRRGQVLTDAPLATVAKQFRLQPKRVLPLPIHLPGWLRR